jgi:hypothetical protein
MLTSVGICEFLCIADRGTAVGAQASIMGVIGCGNDGIGHQRMGGNWP